MSRTSPAPYSTRCTLRPLVHALVALQLLHLPLQAVHAAGVNPSTGGVSVDTAANGVPVVNIAKPNASGISHNSFTRFDVGNQGLILNNSSSPVSTQLGGYITGNANLGGSSARLILNEVTAPNPSQLNGYLEVAGRKAGVIVANPYGITCNGCGFINTSQATLSTGRPRWSSDGSLAGFDVEGGLLRIEGLGLNAGNTEGLALYARVLELNAELYARTLDVVVGANRIEAETHAASALPTSDTAPAYAIDSSVLGGMYADTIRLVGTEAGVGMRLAGPVAALTGQLEILANGDVRLARASAAEALAVAAAGQLQIEGDTSAGGDIGLAATGITLAGETYLTGDNLHLESTAVTLANGSRTAARGDLSFIAADQQLDGSLAATGAVTLTGSDIRHSGALASGTGLAVIADAFANNGSIDIAGGTASIQLTGLFTNAGATLRHGGDQLLINALDIDNRGGEMASNGLLTLISTGPAGLDNTAGHLQGNAGLALTAQGLDNTRGTMVSNGDITLALGAGTLRNASGLVETTGSILAVGGALENGAGTLRAGDDLSLTLPSFRRSTSGGALEAGGLLALHTAGSIILDGDALSTPGSVWLDAGSGIHIDSRLVSGQDTTILTTALSLADDAVVAAQAALVIQADSVVNEGVLFGRLNVVAEVEDSLTLGAADSYRGAALLSEGDISISSRTGEKVGAVNNYGGLIDSSSGSIMLRAQQLLNTNIGWQVMDPYDLPSEFEYSISEYSFNTFHYCCGRYGEDIPTKRIETTVTRNDFADRGQAARILAGGNITLDLGDLFNDHSTISAQGVLDITANSIRNEGTTLVDRITKRSITRWHTCEYDSMGDLECWARQAPTLVSRSDGETETLPAILEGGLDVIIRGTTVNGMPERRGNTVVSDGQAFEGLVITPDDLPPPGDLSLGIADPTAFPGFNLPGNGLFTLVNDPTHPYLIETDPALNTYSGFLGSAYLLERLEGWAPGITQRRLGDGYYEITLVREALLASLGTRFLDPSILDEKAQFVYLMDNAIAASESLHLSPGIALTREQIDALQTDIVWMEERDIAGQKVLVPVVYLAQGSTRILQDGSVISGGALSIEGGSFANAGLVQARGNINVNSSGLLANLGGEIRAGGDLALKSGADLVNESGSIRGDNVALAAAGDIIHRTWTAQESLGSAGNGSWSTVAGETATVEAAGDMVQVAGGSLQLEAARLAAQNIVLAAGGSLTLSTQQVRQGYAFTSADWQTAEEQVRHLQTEVEAAQALRLMAAADITAIAASLKGGDVALEAGGNISLLAAEESDHFEVHSQHDGSVEDKSSDVVHDALRMVGTRIEAGGDLTLTARQGSITLFASSAEAAGQARVSAAANINLMAGIDTTQHSAQSANSNAATFTEHSEGFVQQSAVASRIASGGNLSLDSGGNIALVASSLTSGETLRIGGTAVDQAALATGAVTPGTLPLNLHVGTLALTNQSWSETREGFSGVMEELVKAASLITAPMLSVFSVGQLEIPEIVIGEHSSQRTQSLLQAGSALTAQDMAIRVQDTAAFIGADVRVPGTLAVSASNILIDAAAETHSVRRVEGSDTVQGLGADFDKDKGEYRVAGVQETKTSLVDAQTITQWRGTSINAGNLILQAEQNIDVLGSQLAVVGDAIIQAGGDLTIGGREGIVTQEHRETIETITVGLAVRNAHHDAVQAIEAVNDAKQALEDAKAALDAAERKVALGQLASNDLDYFKVNVAAAAANLTQATIGAAGALATAAAVAAGSAGTGFYATGSAQRDSITTTSTSTQTLWQGSEITVGGNAVLSADNALTAQGSRVAVAETLALNAGSISITAGTERSITSTRTTEDHETAGISVSPTSLSANVGVSLRETDADSHATRYVNSLVSAGTLVSQSDTLRVAGARIVADDIDIETRELVVASLQDEASSQSETRGASAGLGFGYGGGNMSLTTVSGGVEQSESRSDSRWVSEQTWILGSNSIRVRADSTLLTGAVIANAEVGAGGMLIDKGGLDFATGTLIFNDLNDYQYSKTTGFSFNTGINTSAYRRDVSGQKTGDGYATGQTTVGAQYFGHETEQLTQTTLGLGSIVIGGQQLTIENAVTLGVAGLNRDLGQAQEVIRDHDIGGLNANLTVDNRWFSEIGRDHIVDNVLSVPENAKRTLGGATRDLLRVTGTHSAHEVMFTNEAKMYVLLYDEKGQVIRDENLVPLRRYIPEEERSNLVRSSDGKVYVASNGIFNEEPNAAVYASQHGISRATDEPVQRIQYFIHFEQADNVVSELLVAGYQKFFEGGFWGMTNPALELADVTKMYGRIGLHLDGHSRGTMTIGNVLEWMTYDPNNAGQLANTTVNFFGPAEDVYKADTYLATLQDRQNISDINTYNSMILHYQNHASDPVGTLPIVGNNPSTGGTNRNSQSFLGDAFVEAFTALGGENTVHNCYGFPRPGCAGVWDDFSDGKPSLVPVSPYRSTSK